MKWIRTQEQSLPHIRRSVLTIGNFDGVHLGHRKLLQTLVEIAQKHDVPSLVCTFKPHPLQILNPGAPSRRLFDYRDQAENIEAMGIDYLVEEKFTKEMSLMSAVDFMDLYIVKHFNPVHIVVGYDFTFGKDRSGDYSFLEDYCRSKGIGLSQVPASELSGQIISSSAVRKMIEHGDMQKASQFLGRKYYLRGPVKLGYQRGRTLGIPTANISPEIEFIPRKGVYFSRTLVKDQWYHSITNIGVNPTFELNSDILKVETHIFDFSQDIYGEQIRVELDHFHRDEIKFSGIETLKNQIFRDIDEAKKYYQIK